MRKIIIINASDRKNYSLREKKDTVILLKIKELERLNLPNKDKETVRLIKTQLRKDWRTPLILCFNKLIRRYKK